MSSVANRVGRALGWAYLGVLAVLLTMLLGAIVWQSFRWGVRWALDRHQMNVLEAVVWPLAVPMALRARGFYAPSGSELLVVVLLAVAWTIIGWSMLISLCWRWSHRRDRAVSLTAPPADEA